MSFETNTITTIYSGRPRYLSFIWKAVLRKRILSLFGNITRLLEDSVELCLAKHQSEIKSFSSHSWLIVVKKILIKYDLPSPVVLIETPPRKFLWKRQGNSLLIDL